ncbi:AMP-binding protein [Rhizobium grahamii]|uniref:Coenzyme F390 synthetase n=1 Tax=Rhizobium grahamii CCGE 502 TaxID=990285 RepID=S3H6Q9_9HYPH|nr:AMP-binding protein [Rhizobium grahamii]EPE94389.1 coenzyme F390 synthetase [Rhizobium grahamii CCGE 502]
MDAGKSIETCLKFWPDVKVDPFPFHLALMYSKELELALKRGLSLTSAALTRDRIVDRTSQTPLGARHRFFDFNEIPLTKKEDIVRSPSSYVNKSLIDDNITVKFTSGSTGPGLAVLYSGHFYVEELFLSVPRILRAWGVEDFSGTLTLNISDSNHRRGSIAVCPDRRIGVQLDLPIDFRSKTEIQKLIHFVQAWKPRVISSRPELLELICAVGLDAALHATADWVISGGSYLTIERRRRIGSYFSAPVIDVYASTECGIVAWDRPGPNYLVVDQSRHFVELRDGNIVITTIDNLVMPFLRYLTGDRGQLTFNNDIGIKLDPDRNVPLFNDKHGQPFVPIFVKNALNKLGIWSFTLIQETAGTMSIVVPEDVGRNEVERTVLSSLASSEASEEIIVDCHVEIASVSGFQFIGPS